MERTYKPKARLNREEQLTQSQLMVMQRVFGEENTTTKELAEQYNLAPKTVSGRMALAKQSKVPEKVREYFITELLPKSMAVVSEALACDDLKLALQAAKMVIEGLEAMKDPNEQTIQVSEDDSLEIWREKLKITKGTIDV